MAQRKSGLGRGLDALIQARGDTVGGVQEIEIDTIEPNPFQPREDFDADELSGLAASIREHGVIQPIIVAQGRGDVPFQLIAGERRWRAARAAGLRTIPAIIRESSPGEMLQMALIENIQRADLSVLEEAAAYRQLVEEFGLTQGEVAARVGRSRVAVTNALRVLDAPVEVRQALLLGHITEGHARALLGLDMAVEQLAALQIVIARDLTVRQTEQLVRDWRSEPQRREPQPVIEPPGTARIRDAFRRALGTKVEIQQGRKGGRLVIHYYSDEELNSIYQHIVGEPEDDI